MTEFSVHLDRLKSHGRAFLAGVRPHHLGLLAGVAVIGIGVLAVSAVARPGESALGVGERLQIEIVAPVEPTVSPGPVMEVGHLVDSPISLPPPPPPVEPFQDVYYEDGPEVAKPPVGTKRYVEEVVIQTPPRPAEPRRDRWRDQADRWFGFDGPERDYRAEREARRARLEARMDREREALEARRYRSDSRPGEFRRRERDYSPDRED